MTARRTYGSGSIRWRSPSVAELRVGAGVDPVTGRRRVVTETFHGGKKDAQRRLAELVAQHSRHAVGTTATLGDLISRWLEVARIQPSTRANYRTALRHVSDQLVDTPLAKLSAHDLDLYYAALRRRHVGVPTVRTVHAVLSSALAQGVRWRWIAVNPAAFASPPTQPVRRPDPPGEEALARLLAGVGSDEQLSLWLRLAIVTGARRSEVLALRWADVDLDGGRLTVAGALTVDRARKGTKTDKDRRLTLDAATIADLRAWQTKAKERALACGVRLAKSGYILSNEPDSSIPWRPDYASKRFRRLADELGYPDVRLHDLRHANATRLLAAGMDLATVSRRLGHSRSSTTLDVYAHVAEGSDERAAEIAGSFVYRDTTFA